MSACAFAVERAVQRTVQCYCNIASKKAAKLVHHKCCIPLLERSSGGVTAYKVVALLQLCSASYVQRCVRVRSA
jgi:hypothetical protein